MKRVFDIPTSSIKSSRTSMRYSLKVNFTGMEAALIL
jgi:hypothetical protein